MKRIGLFLALALTLASCGDAGQRGLAALARGELENFLVHSAPRPAHTGTFEDFYGGPVSLADFEGRVVLLNIWATWCAPCVHEMPQLDALAAEYSGDEFVVLALSTDRIEREEVERVLREDIGAEHLPLFFDPSSAYSLGSQVVVWPTTILYDREGRELGRISGPAEWNSADAHRLIEAAIAQGAE